MTSIEEAKALLDWMRSERLLRARVGELEIVLESLPAPPESPGDAASPADAEDQAPPWEMRSEHDDPFLYPSGRVPFVKPPKAPRK